MFKKFLVLVMLLLSLVGCNKGSFATPEETINTYYYSLANKDLKTVNACFIDGEFQESSLGKHWESYKIKQKRIVSDNDVIVYEAEVKQKYNNEKYQSLYDVFIKNRHDYKMSGDVEITVVNKMKPNGKEIEFWYLLRKIDGEWKIINHAAQVEGLL